MTTGTTAAAEQAYATIRTLKAGTWEAVEALSVLVANHPRHPEARQALATAASTASRLKAGTWESVRALAWLEKAQAAVG